MFTDLRCPACGNTYPDRWRCACGHPLEFADRPLPDGPPPEVPDARDGLWTFEAFLPVERRVSLDEGWTPLVEAPGWDCSFKLDYTFPTGSFKDRGAATTLSRAAELDVDRVVEDSSGNAGAAIATYAARAGIDARIYVPASVKASKLRAIERAGAEVERVEGSREAVTEACVSAVERAARRAAERTSGDEPRVARESWYASHAWNPAFFAGTATMAYEIAAQRDWSVPDAVVLPLGHGTMFLGAYRGFTALQEAGWTDGVPRLLGAQAAGYAPVADGFHGPSEERNDLADGIQIREPVRVDEIREAVEATGGDATAIGPEATERELDRLHAAGFYTEPTCAVAPAALREYRDRGVLEPDADVVVALSGSGLKT
ncbi:MAG: pyridoxal-phosphate dependent enzyme [Haloarculaceae archaeon]